MNEEVRIEEVSNGYILKGLGILKETEVYGTLDEVFDRLLTYFEGLCEHFNGPRYGKVSIKRGEDEKSTSRQARGVPE